MAEPASTDAPGAVCSLCGVPDAELLLTDLTDVEYSRPGVYGLARCMGCGLTRLQPFPAPGALVDLYPPEYHSYHKPVSRLTRFLIRKAAKKHAGEIAQLIGTTGRVLDIGCADGALFDEWSRYGDWEFVGVEFQDGIAEAGRQAGRDVRTGTLEEVDFGDERFRLILMNHLIEHVTDPTETLETSFRLLEPGGRLLGETPNIASLDYVLTGRHWGGLHVPRHLYLYSPKTLRAHLERTGFEEIAVTPKLHTGHWALSIQNWIQSFRPARIVQGRTWYYPSLLLAFIPLNMIQMLLNCTGAMGFVARKPEGT